MIKDKKNPSLFLKIIKSKSSISLIFAVSIVIGIPTIRRDKTSYLQQTVASLIQGMSVEEQKECLIVVFVAEVGL